MRTKPRDVVRDLLEFPRYEGGIKDDINSIVRFASAKPCSGVVDAHEHRQPECRRVDSSFQPLAGTRSERRTSYTYSPALQD